MAGQTLDIAPFMVWVVVAAQLLNFAIAVWGVMASGSRANGKKIDEQGRRLDAIDLRLQSAEQGQRALPTVSDMHKLELGMEAIKGKIDTMAEKMVGQGAILTRVEAIVARHEEHLLEGAGRD